MTFDNYLSNFSAALHDEINYAKKFGGKRYLVENGEYISTDAKGYLYHFEIDVEAFIPEASPIILEYMGRRYRGELLSIEGFDIYLYISNDLGKRISKAEFTCEPWTILEQLIERLHEPKMSGSTIARKLIMNDCDGKKSFKLPKGQAAAQQLAQTQPITLIWGPPGTGKTHTLANIALSFFYQRMRVLVVSHSNISVDGAVKKIGSILTELGNTTPICSGEILRYGYVRDTELTEKYPLVSSFQFTLSSNPALVKEKSDLENKRNELHKQLKLTFDKNLKEQIEYQLSILMKKLKLIRDSLKFEEKRYVQKAKILATTISKAVVDPTIYENLTYDVVILDEASMAYIPQVCYSASLTSKHFICLGDFNQLPPIALSNTPTVDQWLKRDIYQHLGICDEENHFVNHPWLVLLDEQRRMSPAISRFPNRFMYGNLIKDFPDVVENNRGIVDKLPFHGLSLALLDLSGMQCICYSDADESKVNFLSAFATFSLAVNCALYSQQSIGIITPYAAQAKLINSMLKDANTDSHIISCSTVHQFQGNEKGVIILDCVYSYRRQTTGQMISGQTVISKRLINVAITRAKGKLITVANRSFFENKLYKKDALILRLFEHIKSNGTVQRTDNAIKELIPSVDQKSHAWYVKRKDYFNKVLNDFNAAKKNIQIEISSGRLLYTQEEIKQLLAVFENAKKRGLEMSIKVENPSDLPAGFQSFCEKSVTTWANLSIIDDQITWYGFPQTDNKIIVQSTELKFFFWPVIRFVGKRTASFIRQITSASNDGQEEPNNKEAGLVGFLESQYTCKKCGNPMKVRKARTYFLSCSSYPRCHYTEPIDAYVIDEYIRKNKLTCNTCSYPLQARNGKYGVYIRCTNPGKPHSFNISEI